MRPSPVRDLIVGLFVVAGLGAVGYLTIHLGGLSYKGPGGLQLYATFDEIGGLTPRAPVTISGVKVGQVVAIGLDPSLRARVTMDLDASLELPVDTRAEIRTSGVLGDQFMALEPGAEDELLGPGDEIAFTENALLLERLVGRLVHDADMETE
jgi:phospholipid/cholesterol/gamma-HCH transport system substrate-binding protein